MRLGRLTLESFWLLGAWEFGFERGLDGLLWRCDLGPFAITWRRRRVR